MLKPVSSLLVLSFLFPCCLAAAAPEAQKKAAPATYVTPEQMQTALKTAPDQKAALIDRPVRVIQSGNHNLGVAMVQRQSADVHALAHDQIDEVYYILDGGGTMVTGGTITEAQKTGKSDTIGPGWSGKSIEGGESRRVDPGAVVFIPAGTPHMFTKLDGVIHYLIYRVDPDRILPTK